MITLKPFELQVSPVRLGQAMYQRLYIPGCGLTTIAGAPELPEIGVVLAVGGSDEPKVAIIDSDYEEMNDVKIVPVAGLQQTVAGEPVSQVFEGDAYKADAFWPTQVVDLESRAELRGQKLVRLRISPVQYNAARKTLRVYHSLKVVVTMAGLMQEASLTAGTSESGFKKLLRITVANPQLDVSRGRKHASDSASAPDGWYNPLYHYTKLFVDDDGIYSLSFGDLSDAGVNPAMFNRSGVKVLNRGKQVPVWIDGPVTATFGPQNTLYFWGDRNRSDPDYYALYTDRNVYWLTADGGPGLRYSDISDSKGGSHPESYYWQRVHLEQDNLFHRINTSSAVEAEEGWIWRYLFDNDREVVFFEVSAVATPECTLRVRLHGTTLDPASPDHHIRVSINDQLIAERYFDDRSELLVSETFPSSLLRPGQNKLELHLVPDTGALINQIFLDWFDILYPRKLVARDSTLSFSPVKPTGQPTRYAVNTFGDENIFVFEPDAAKLWRPRPDRQSIYQVKSAGLDDGKFVQFELDFEPHFFRARGHTLAVIDSLTGQAEFRSFDTFGSTQAADEMAQFIQALPNRTLVLVGISDDGSRSMTENAFRALESLGSTQARDVRFRDSWALTAIKGAPNKATETLSRQFSGWATVRDTLRDSHAFRYAVAFTDTVQSGATYHTVAASQIKKIVAFEPDKSSNLRSPNSGADYLVVTHAAFLSEARRLAAFRSEASELRSVVVDVQDIYDEFNYGLPDPHAIKDFLRYTFQNWQSPAPSYLVLFGDASWDSKRRLPESFKIDYVPSYGILVADNWYATMGGIDDVLPDLFVGRIPVESLAQAKTVVDKIITYESLTFEDWSKKILFLNGGINESEQSLFLSQANTLIARHLTVPPFAGDITSFNKTINESILHAFKNPVADAIRDGQVWVNFIGHAGSSIWDIDIGGPADWENSASFPFVTGMSCHSARFANPSVNSLSEGFFVSDFGACAYWGSTGFGYVTQDFFLLEGLFKAVMQDTIRELGPATTAAKLHLWQQLGAQARSRHVIDQYTLIGDPALRLKIPKTPEFAVRQADLKFESSFLLTTDSTAVFDAKIRNFGLMPTDSVVVRLSVEDSGGERNWSASEKLPAFSNVDSISTAWPIPAAPGTYRLLVSADPENRIVEALEDNNSASREIQVFTSDLTLLRPINFASVRQPPRLVTSNSRLGRPSLKYFFEVDTSASFTSAWLQKSTPIPENVLTTAWQPELNTPGVYFWRTRTYDGANYGAWVGASFLYAPTETGVWQQSENRQFFENTVVRNLDLSVAGEIKLASREFVYRAESAGFFDGNFALLERNREIFELNHRGHNIAVFDPSNGTLLALRSFDTYKAPEFSDSLATMISRLPDSVVVLVAVRDDGATSITEGAHLALESIGSRFTRQLEFRDSWGIIGKKGAPVGSVVEGLQKPGDGPVVLIDTLHRFAGLGQLTSVKIGPSHDWRSAILEASHGFGSGAISIRVLGIDAVTGTIDTLMSGMPAGAIDLSSIDPASYPEIRLDGIFSSADGLRSPTLRSWSVDYSQPAELVVDRHSISVEVDTLQVGEPLRLGVTLGNFGFVGSDSISVAVSTARDGQVPSMHEFRLASLNAGDVRTDALQLDGFDRPGRVDLTAEIDPAHEIPELNETNNTTTATIWVVRDTVSPDIRVTFDGREVAEDGFVSANPAVRVEFRDQGAIALDDTSRLTVFLDQRKITYGPAAGQARFLPRDNPDDKNLQALALLQPQLSEGEHHIEVIARDGAGNPQFYQSGFVVSDRFVIANVMNYPNPFSGATHFTYILTQPADQVRIKIYTVAGRLIHELEAPPGRVGFNQLQWDGRDQVGDRLANGVYLYKIIARRGEEQTEVVEKLVVMR